MAPEFPPILVIATLRFEGKRLMAILEYVESIDFSRPLTVRWSAATQPERYRSVGGGVAYVFDEAEKYNILPVSEDASAIELGNGRYLWKEGIQVGAPRVMFILVLPNGQTIEDPWPLPAGTKIFGDRLALYWMLSKYDDGHADVEWTLKSLEVDLESEQISLNRKFLSRKRASPSFVRVEDAVQPGIEVSRNADANLKSPFAFVAMPMNPDDDALVDVLETIKVAAQRCGIRAERVDDQQSNDRISDRMLKSIAQADYVVADLTHARPNVYFEAGFAHGQGKTPIYVARQGTSLEFDLKDYPALFFRNLKELRDSLETRLKALATPSERTP
jgi:hypothetical protein